MTQSSVLTAKQIKQEPAGRRLDGWIAEYVMNYSLIPIPPVIFDDEHPGEHLLFYLNGDVSFYVPFFSTRIEHFCLVFEKITKPNGRAKKSCTLLFEIHADSTRCKLAIKGKRSIVTTAEGPPLQAIPLAGCRAVLLHRRPKH